MQLIGRYIVRWERFEIYADGTYAKYEISIGPPEDQMMIFLGLRRAVGPRGWVQVKWFGG